MRKPTRTKSPGKYDALTSPATSEQRKPKLDVHAAVTAKIVAAIAAGAGEFQMPWHRPGVAFSIPKNALTDKPYRGSNILSLWIDADAKKFEHQIFATYKQWQEMKAQVRGGEKGSLIVKYGEWTPKNDREAAGQDSHGDNDGEDAAKRLYAKAAWVFNIDQVDLPAELRAKLLPATAPRPDLTERLAHVDAFIAATQAEFREGGQRAFYRHRGMNGEGDFIQMPPRNLFTGTTTSTPTESYESTRLHELSHWAGAEHRLNRKFGERFGDKEYSFEEIIAELSASFLCAELEISNTPRADHAQYIAHWLEILKSDSKAIFTAASQASRTVEYLMALQDKGRPAPRPDVDAGPERPGASPPSATAESAEGPR